MIAGKLKPYYEAQAKDRQEAALKQGNKTKHGDKSSNVEKIPQSRKSKSRDEAGKAAGVNSKYVDMATQVLSVDAKLGEQVMAEGHDRR